MLVCRRLGIADPLTRHSFAERPFKLVLASLAEIVEQVRPGGDSGAPQDPHQVRPQIAVGHAVAGDDVLRSLWGIAE